jgi:MFS family permease
MGLYLRRFFGFTTPVPPEHRKNFIHLYWDVALWGLLNGSIINFLGVYCSRIGATPLQMGLLTAIPALMNLIVTVPATVLLRGKPMSRVVPVAALITRFFYLALVPLPILLPQETQLWVILGIVLLQNVTGAIANMMGTAFLAESIPPTWRGQVVGTRSALVAMTSMLTSLAVGQILASMSLANGYLVVFALGFAGSMASAFQLFQIKPVVEDIPLVPANGAVRVPTGKISLSILKGPFRRVLLVMFMLNIGIFLPQAIFPLYQVNELHLTDRIIGLAFSLFSVVQFVSSSQAGKISRRWGFKKMTGAGMLIASLSTLMFTFSYSPWLYFATQFVGGFGWAIFNNGAVNYLLEKIPSDDRPPHLAWFNLTANSAVLICGMLSAQIAAGIGLFGGMVLAIVIRVIAGILMLKFG